MHKHEHGHRKGLHAENGPNSARGNEGIRRSMKEFGSVAFELAVKAAEQGKYSDMKVNGRECEYPVDPKKYKESHDLLVEAIFRYEAERRN